MGRCFNRDEWIKAASERRCIAACKTFDASSKSCEDVEFIDKLARVVDWCNRRGLTVEFTAESGGSYAHTTKTVRVTYRCVPEQQLYIILHEAGHHLIHSSPRRLYLEKYEHGYDGIDVGERATEFKMDVVAEEYEAWQRGLKLARRLELDVDKERYERRRNANVKSYFRWALDHGGKKKEKIEEKRKKKRTGEEGEQQEPRERSRKL